MPSLHLNHPLHRKLPSKAQAEKAKKYKKNTNRVKYYLSSNHHLIPDLCNLVNIYFMSHFWHFFSTFGVYTMLLLLFYRFSSSPLWCLQVILFSRWRFSSSSEMYFGSLKSHVSYVGSDNER